MIIIDESQRMAAPGKFLLESTVYRFGTASIGVTTKDFETGRWLQEFFTPWFSVDTPAQTDLQVFMTVSEKRFRDLTDREAKSKTQVFPCFCLDSTLISHHGWIDRDGATVVLDKEFGCFYLIKGSQVEVVFRPHDLLMRMGLMRVVRELAVLRTFNQSKILDIHAAAFVFRDRAILLAGDKQAGKTTLLAHVVASGQAAFLANDRVMIDGHLLQANGVPTVVSVRKKTKQVFAALGRGMPERATLLHEGELASSVGTEVDTARRLFLSPMQFVRQLGGCIVPRAPIGAIVFPEISSSTATWSLESITPAEGVAQLRKCFYAAHSFSGPDTIFQSIVGRSRHADSLDILLDHLAAVVPFFRCRLGKNAYRHRADSWLNELPLYDELEPR